MLTIAPQLAILDKELFDPDLAHELEDVNMHY